jgi:hypothetical protein
MANHTAQRSLLLQLLLQALLTAFQHYTATHHTVQHLAVVSYCQLLLLLPRPCCCCRCSLQERLFPQDQTSPHLGLVAASPVPGQQQHTLPLLLLKQQSKHPNLQQLDLS